MNEIDLTLAKLNLFHVFYIATIDSRFNSLAFDQLTQCKCYVTEDKRDEGCRVGIDVIKN